MFTYLRPLSFLVVFLVWGCGDAASGEESVGDTAADLVDGVRDSFTAIVDAANAYVAEDQLTTRRKHCDLENGEFVARLQVGPCVDGKVELDIDGEPQTQACDGGEGGLQADQCVHRSASGLVYYNDGPSTPVAVDWLSQLSDDYDITRWNQLFWSAAVNHDYCYHHNGKTRGLSRADCDQQMLSDLSAVCAAEKFADIAWFDADVCRRNAVAAYALVRGCGEGFFALQNSEVDYPAWQPMWQRLGLGQDPFDAGLQKEVDDFVARYNICD